MKRPKVLKRNISSFTRAESTHLWAFSMKKSPRLFKRSPLPFVSVLTFLWNTALMTLMTPCWQTWWSRSGNIKESLGYIYAKAGEIQRYAENLGDYRDIKKKQAEVIGKVAGLVSPERSKVQLLQEHSTLVQGHFMVSGIPLRKQATKQR